MFFQRLRTQPELLPSRSPCCLLFFMQLAGGPEIPMRYGRKDAASEAECAPDGFLPGADHALRGVGNS